MATLLAPHGSASGATFLVNSDGDAGDVTVGNGACSTGVVIVIQLNPLAFGLECTLRAALEEANASAGFDTIEFSGILPTIAGVVEIRPATSLPFITDQILIDGYSHPNYDEGEANSSPMINVVGNLTPSGTNGIVFLAGSDDSTLRGLAIVSFPASGILLSAFFLAGPSGVLIQGNQLGISRGVFYLGNGLDGVTLFGSDNNTIGLDCNLITGCQGRRNVIASNGRSGVRVDTATGNRIAGNYIGVDRFGSATFVPFGGATPNAEYGVHLLSTATGNEVGSTGAIFDSGMSTPLPVAAGNVISGNLLGGVRIEGIANFVYANHVGTNAAGTGALANQGAGIHVEAADNRIGAVGVAGNLVSGNTSSGIVVLDVDLSVDDVIIEGNRVGLNITADAVLGNGVYGVSIDGDRHIIDQNVIGGNALDGIRDSGDGSIITSNYVGTNAAGLDLGNAGQGIRSIDGNSVIGGIGQGNIIGFNEVGIEGTASSFGAEILGNWIGTNPAGDDLGNAQEGIRISGAAYDVGATDGLASGDANVIGFNGAEGIVVGTASFQTLIVANYVGTDGLGRDLGNHQTGIRVESEARVGGTLAALPIDVAPDGNVVAFNGASILVTPGTSNTPIRGNLIWGNDEIAIDLSPLGATGNDPSDLDAGANEGQNYPLFDFSLTSYDFGTGDLSIRYRVDSTPANSLYPLTIDFYLIDSALQPGDQAGRYIGSDSYPLGSAGNYRSIILTPNPGTGLVSGGLRATATDADGNTSELSPQLVPVPEPSVPMLLIAGALLVMAMKNPSRAPPLGL